MSLGQANKLALNQVLSGWFFGQTHVVIYLYHPHHYLWHSPLLPPVPLPPPGVPGINNLHSLEPVWRSWRADDESAWRRNGWRSSWSNWLGRAVTAVVHSLADLLTDRLAGLHRHTAASGLVLDPPTLPHLPPALPAGGRAG